MDPRPTIDAPDDDPWLWLEEVEGERATAWADAQTAATLARFGDAASRPTATRCARCWTGRTNLPVRPARRAAV